MKNIIFLSIFLSIFTTSVQAQNNRDAIKGAAAAAGGVGKDAAKLPDDSLIWKKGGDISLNFSQTSLSNWAAGGEPTIAFGSSSNLYANYKKEKIIWENYAFMAYGVIKAKDRDAVKNSDQFNVGSRVGYNLSKNWYYSAALLGKTQFAPGYRYSGNDTTFISNFLAPAYVFLSLGLDYKPSSNFSVSFSPAMGKATFVNSNDTIVIATAGIAPKYKNKDKDDFYINGIRKSRYEFGAGIVFNLNGNFFDKKVTYTSQLELFSNYFDKPQNLDVVWDFQLRVALAKHISAGMRINMIYYDSQKTFKKENGVDVMKGPQIQIKQYFELGLFYKF